MMMLTFLLPLDAAAADDDVNVPLDSRMLLLMMLTFLLPLECCCYDDDDNEKTQRVPKDPDFGVKC